VLADGDRGGGGAFRSRARIRLKSRHLAFDEHALNCVGTAAAGPGAAEPRRDRG
jgi:hypothetical protein